jgi:hypothetical protein
MRAIFNSVVKACPWAEFVRDFACTALILALAAWAFNVLVDPYGANPLRIHFTRPLMDINQRFMYPQVLRSGVFDSAIFGTSTIRLLSPSDLENAFGGHFANFGMNAATPFEQNEAARLYVAHTPNLRTLIWGIDPSWCQPDADAPEKLLTERAFPPWLYGGNPWWSIPHLFNLRTLEITARVVLNRLGLMRPRLPRDGYEVFTPPETSYDLARAREHIFGGGPRPTAPSDAARQARGADISETRYPALDWLDATLGKVPPDARVVLMFPPVHVANQPVPNSSDAALEATCKRRIAAIAKEHHGVTVDFRFASPITSDDANYWDALHYRLPIARRVVESLADAAKGERKGEMYRVIESAW